MPKLLLLLAGLALTGCAPRLAPLYRDYRAPDTLALARAERALGTAGWTLRPEAPAGTLATDVRGGSEFGLYRTHLSVEVVPLGGGLVRVLFDPVRRYAWGDRTHIPYLPGGLSRPCPARRGLRARPDRRAGRPKARRIGRRTARLHPFSTPAGGNRHGGCV
jgi:hypothetical protein